MAVKNQTDEAYLNNPHTQEFPVVDDDSATTPKPPLDLTDREIKWGMVPIDPSTGLFATSPLTLQKTVTGGGIVITDAANGECEVNIDDADTAGLNAGDYHFQLEVFDDAGENGVVVAEGTLTLLPNLQEV